MDELEVYELYDVWYKPWWQSTPAKIILACSVIFIVLLFIRFIMRYISARKAIPFWQRALDQCVQLKKNSDTLALPILYAQVTALLKDYLEKRYNEQFKQLTDQELREKIEALPLSQLQKERVTELLTYAVPAKFDADQHTIADPVIHIAYLETLIKETHQQPTPP
ncbi:MAG: hypothetical protein AB7F19_06150 [Candidatus Babeliales bacterium]